uniref:Uncharacterized protein n=1 Tax=Rhizophora mucronata TaxID=61149 RepID=A0A2P2QTL8_RHIMU
MKTTSQCLLPRNYSSPETFRNFSSDLLPYIALAHTILYSM